MTTRMHSTNDTTNNERDELVRAWKQKAVKAATTPIRSFMAVIDGYSPIQLSIRTDSSVNILSALKNSSDNVLHNVDIIESAVALHCVEPFVQQLEDWLGIALDFSPTQAAHSPANDVLCAEFSIADEKVNAPAMQGTIALPLSLLAEVDAPPKELSQQLKFATLECTLELDSVQLTQEQLQKISLGDAVILRSSFELDWEVQLKPRVSPRISRSALISVHTDIAELVTTSAASPMTRHKKESRYKHTDRNMRRYAVVLSSDFDISVGSILGWHVDNYSIPLSAEGGLRAILRDNTRSIAEGEIIPAGDGYALWINRLSHTHTSAESVNSVQSARDSRIHLQTSQYAVPQDETPDIATVDSP
jgi:hypothetical protein